MPTTGATVSGRPGPASAAGDTPTADRAAGRARRSNGAALWLAVAGVALLSFNITRVADEYPISDLFFVASTVVVLLNIVAGKVRNLTPRSARVTPPLLLIGCLLLLTGGTLSSIGSLDAFGSILRVVRLGWITILWFWLLRTVASNRQRLEYLVLAFKLTMLVAAVVAISNYLGLTEWGETRLQDRENAYFTHPNMLGGALAVSLPFFLMNVPRSSKERRGELFLTLGQIGLILAAISTTGSMTSMVGAVGGAVATLGLRMTVRSRTGRRRRNTPLTPLLAMAIAAAGIVALAGSDFPVVDRFAALTSNESSSISRSAHSRPEQNQYVLDQFDRFLIVGVGHDEESLGTEWDADTAGDGAHNIFAKLFYEAGLISVVGFLLIITVIGRQGWELTKGKRDTPMYPVMVALFGSFVAANAVAQLNPVITERWYWFPSALIGAAWALRRQEPAVSEAQT